MNLLLRREKPSDYRIVEELTREAFWNLYVPGCDEHYLAHLLREHPDFIPELDHVAVLDDVIVGSIMYTRSRIVDEHGIALDTLTFGPVCVHPEFQKRGIGSALIQHTIEIAVKNGETAIIIFGHPRNYCRHGFRNGRDFMVSNVDGRYPFGLLVRELRQGLFGGRQWKFHLSPAYTPDLNKSDEFDRQFPLKTKEQRHTQAEFSIACRAYLD